MMEEIVVSVYCLAYNHGEYIRKALDGFVSQKTDFKYEVFVHDDASTDNTAEIIREYAEKYPEIIKPIFQTENQYSQGVKIVSKYIYPKIRGKYIAVCEGDDYWCDANKLQFQYEAMERHPECSMCSHYAIVKDVSTDKILKLYPEKSKELKEGIIDENIQFHKVLFDVFHLNSCFFRKTCYDKYIEYREENNSNFIKLMPAGDIALNIFFSEMGKMYFIDREMSVYNKGVEGSWTQRIQRTKEKNIEHINRYIEALKASFGYIASDKKRVILQEFIEHLFVINEMNKGNYKGMFQRENRSLYKKLPFRLKIKLLIGCVFPRLIDNYDQRKNRGV